MEEDFHPLGRLFARERAHTRKNENSVWAPLTLHRKCVRIMSPNHNLCERFRCKSTLFFSAMFRWDVFFFSFARFSPKLRWNQLRWIVNWIAAGISWQQQQRLINVKWFALSPIQLIDYSNVSGRWLLLVCALFFLSPFRGPRSDWQMVKSKQCTVCGLWQLTRTFLTVRAIRRIWCRFLIIYFCKTHHCACAHTSTRPRRSRIYWQRTVRRCTLYTRIASQSRMRTHFQWIFQFESTVMWEKKCVCVCDREKFQ